MLASNTMRYMADKKVRKDSQTSGLAGELFVAAELLKRDIQTSVTFGNAKSIDLLAYNPDIGKPFQIQVKSLRSNNYFLTPPRDRIHPDHVWVFVLLNKPGVAVRYFIVLGADLVNHPERFGPYLDHPTMPGVSPKDLLDFEDNWAAFGCPV
jgi:hypothetical protein